MKLKALVMTVATIALGATLLAQDPARERKLQQAIDLLETKGDAVRAMPLLEDVAKSADQSLAARGLLYLGQAQERQENARARATYERIVRDFGQQQQVVAQARARLAALTVATPLAPATITSRLIAKIDRPAYALGTMSRDGRYLPVVDKNDVWLFDVTTGIRRILIPKDAEREVYVEGVVFSPDGKQMAYAGSSDKTKSYELRVATVASGGKDSRRVFDGELNWIDPCDFSPDGASLLVRIQRESRGAIELAVISTRDGAMQSLDLPRPVGWWRAGFSPDGRFIAAEVGVGNSTASDIAILELNGRRRTPVVAHRAHDVFVGWSPDGSRVIFTSDRGGGNGLWAQRVRDGAPDGIPERLRSDIGRFDPIGVTSSGAVYSSDGFQGPQVEVHSGTIDFGTGRFLESPSAIGRECNAGSTTAPDYSSDGRSLAYLCIRRSAGRLDVSMAIEPIGGGGAGRELRSGLSGMNGLRWIPNTAALLVAGTHADGTAGWWRMNALTGDVTLVSRRAVDGPLDVIADFSQDGSKVYFRRTLAGGKERALVAHDLASREETELFRGPHSTVGGEQQEPRISPDGRQVYFRRALPGSVRPFVKAEFVAKDVATGKERIIIGGRSLGGLNISPDGKYFATGSNDETTKTRSAILITIADGAVRELMRVPIPVSLQRTDAPNVNPLGLVKWSRDGRSLLAETNDVGKPTELWWVDVAGQLPPTRLSADWKGEGMRLHPDGRQVVFTNRTAGRVEPTEVWALEGVIK